MAFRDDIIEGKKQEFEILREEFFPGARCFLLKQKGSGGVAYTQTLEVVDWYLDTKDKKLLIATDSIEIGKKILVSDHFSVSGRVYQISSDDGEGGDTKVAPEGEEPWWKLSFKRTGETFEPI